MASITSDENMNLDERMINYMDDCVYPIFCNIQYLVEIMQTFGDTSK